MVETVIRDMLLAVPTIAAAVEQRIHPYILPEGAAFPALTYFLVETPDIHQEGPSGILETDFQISVWAVSSPERSGYATARALASEVRRALLGKQARTDEVAILALNGGRIQLDPPEVETDIWHAIVEFDLIARIYGQ